MYAGSQRRHQSSWRITITFLTLGVLADSLRHENLRAQGPESIAPITGQEEIEPNANAKSGQHVLHFPSDRVMGLLLQRNRGKFQSSWDGWQRLAKAAGDVSVPDDKELRLELNLTACRDLSPLRQLRSNDLHMLYARDVELADDALTNIAHLTGLEVVEFWKTQLGKSALRSLSQLPRLKTLQLSITAEGNAGLANLVRLKSLGKLGLHGTGVTDDGLEHVAEFKFLEDLQLATCDFTDAGLAHLEKLQSLRRLDLQHCLGVTNSGLAHLRKVGALGELSLNDTPIGDDALAHLAHLKNLKHLWLYGTNVTDAGLGNLKGLVLEELKLPASERITDAGLASIAEIASLRRLEIYDSPITDRGLAHLSELHNLEWLSLNGHQGRVTNEGMTHIAKLSRLKTLWVVGTNLGNEGLGTLTKLNSLETLLLAHNQITWEGLNHLQDFPSLTTLDVSEIKGPNASLRHLMGLKKLRQLTLTKRNSADHQLGVDGIGDGDSDLGVEYLAGLKELEDLSIDSFPITEKGLETLSRLSSLRRLKLTNVNNQISDDDLRHLAGMPNLETLSIRGNITDSGLEHFSVLRSLQTLNILSRTVSDGAIQQLESTIPSLRQVSKITRPLLKKPLQIGQVAPDFQLETLDGKSIRLSDQRGTAVLLYFWATWCSPCVKSIPDLKQLHEDLSQKHERFKIISLSLDHDDDLFRASVKRYEMSWPQARIGLDSPISADYTVSGAPTYVLVGPHGRVVLVSHDNSKMKGAVQSALQVE